MRRPAGITLLAVLNFFGASQSFGLALGFLLAPHALSTLLFWLDNSQSLFTPDEYSLGQRFMYASLACLAGVLLLIYARGFWRLKNWARVICIFFSILGLGARLGDDLSPLPYLLSERLAPALWPYSHFVTSGLLGTLLNFTASVIVITYLLRPSVKEAFGANSAEWKWIAAVTVFALVVLGQAFYKSGPELAAIRWHAKHGDTVVVNGISFPIDYWSVPDLLPNESGVTIDNSPGPLRPKRNNHRIFVEVLGFKAEDERDLTVNERLERKVQSYHRSHYEKLTQFQLEIAKQTLYCVHENEFGFGGSLYCFGDGPIYSVYFTGSSSSLDRFRSMMAESKYVAPPPKS